MRGGSLTRYNPHRGTQQSGESQSGQGLQPFVSKPHQFGEGISIKGNDVVKVLQKGRRKLKRKAQEVIRTGIAKRKKKLFKDIFG